MKSKYIGIILCFAILISMVGCKVTKTEDVQDGKDIFIAISNDIAEQLNALSKEDESKKDSIIKEAKVENSGYAFLLSKEFIIIVHPNTKLVNKEYLGDSANGIFKPIIESFKDKDQDAIIYEYGGQKKILVLTRLSDGNILAVTSNLNK